MYGEGARGGGAGAARRYAHWVLFLRRGEFFSYFRIPKALFQDHRFRQLSTDARTLYGILLDRMSLSVRTAGWTSKGGCISSTPSGKCRNPLLRRAQGGQTIPGAGGHRPHRAQTPWFGQTQPDLRQGLFLRLAQSASTELPKQQFRCCRKRNSGAAKTASK